MEFEEIMQSDVETDSQTQTQTQTQTQSQSDVTMTPSQATQEEKKAWGKLVPSEKCPKFSLVWLYTNEYKAGKQEDCDIIFTCNNINKEGLQVISRMHFTIKRDFIPSINDFVVVLTDHSRNGTFVNRKIVGRDKSVVLENKDEIAVGRAQFTERTNGSYAVFTFDGDVTYSNNELPSQLASEYTVIKKLGSGAAGDVHMVLSKKSFNTFAIKSISKGKYTEVGPRNPLHDPIKIQREVDILQKLQHPCIIKMETIIDTSHKVFIVLELMEGGELFDRISRASGLPEKVTKFMFWQICDAVAYLHSQGITHRDLKPENILLASDAKYPLVKVSDFGMSKFLDAPSMLKTYCGTPLYVAPEILRRRGMGAYTAQVDVWSLGVILYVMLSGLCPFTQNDPTMPLDQQIIRGFYRFPSHKFDDVSIEARDLIKSMLKVNPVRRKTMKQVLAHSWLRSDVIVGKAVRALLRASSSNENTPPVAPNVIPQVNPIREHVFDVPGSKPKRARLN
ncbi:ovarian-specific serine/threonine-protein kinase Lok isoform X1 [Fopius arisanus]|uniref:Ovarian-specific serine/threonine-protein kinase Lok isoform X1 n=1 Tax=Fopius arisanus TaxID=64838 RepID=A0A9R1TBW2_9HYME|nr:PREDICTED: ovarian-specific serine/threonine-protein kinase Lok isoform X1 [Fopius arisanus]